MTVQLEPREFQADFSLCIWCEFEQPWLGKAQPRWRRPEPCSCPSWCVPASAELLRAALLTAPQRVASLNFSWCGPRPRDLPRGPAGRFQCSVKHWLRKANSAGGGFGQEKPRSSTIGKYLFSSLEKLKKKRARPWVLPREAVRLACRSRGGGARGPGSTAIKSPLPRRGRGAACAPPALTPRRGRAPAALGHQ